MRKTRGYGALRILGLHNITYRTLHLLTKSVENHSPAEKLWTNPWEDKFNIKISRRFKGTCKRCRIFRMIFFLHPSR